jgi:hypothetical protein
MDNVGRDSRDHCSHLLGLPANTEGKNGVLRQCG